uniref:Putative secreted protein n=1 Tax=Anopheles darlingi TaxID=43151 RepID=A0A2M4DFY5_ANODA
MYAIASPYLIILSLFTTFAFRQTRRQHRLRLPTMHYTHTNALLVCAMGTRRLSKPFLRANRRRQQNTIAGAAAAAIERPPALNILVTIHPLVAVFGSAKRLK